MVQGVAKRLLKQFVWQYGKLAFVFLTSERGTGFIRIILLILAAFEIYIPETTARPTGNVNCKEWPFLHSVFLYPLSFSLSSWDPRPCGQFWRRTALGSQLSLQISGWLRPNGVSTIVSPFVRESPILFLRTRDPFVRLLSRAAVAASSPAVQIMTGFWRVEYNKTSPQFDTK